MTNALRLPQREVRPSTKRYTAGESVPAWDVYLIFDRNAEWKDQPPAPQDWMHQLPRAPAERRLDGDALAAKAARLLNPEK